jgi:hypothetical protein
MAGMKKLDKEEIKKRIRAHQFSDDDDTNKLVERIVDEVHEDIEAKKIRARLKYAIAIVGIVLIIYFSEILPNIISLLHSIFK